MFQALEPLIAHGNHVFCSCCGKTARRFFPAGVENVRLYARCAFCQSLERHRLIARKLTMLSIPKQAKVLIVAPEQPLVAFLRRTLNATITTLDLYRTDVDVQGDICALPFGDASFDVVIANHVLEHIVDDAKALSELHRVTKIGGRAIVQTPIDWSRAETDEDASLSSQDRILRFGQADHIRQYGNDIIQRIQNTGWTIQVQPVDAEFSVIDCARFGFENDERFLDVMKQ